LEGERGKGGTAGKKKVVQSTTECFREEGGAWGKVETWPGRSSTQKKGGEQELLEKKGKYAGRGGRKGKEL